jgi:exodeoxyribonuclease VII large subunit
MSLFDDPSIGAAVEPTYSVIELSDRIGNVLRAGFRDEVWVRGEIRDLSRPKSGHVYFTLTEVGDEPGSGATLSVMLSAKVKASVNATLKLAGGSVRFSDGTDVRIRCRLDWYGPRGQLQLRMTSIDPAYTLGQLELARAELLHRLAEEGLLRANAEHPWPLLPLRVGLVTSAESAADHDFLDELRSSGFAFEVLRVDSRVQGLEAPRSIADAITRLATHRPDVICVVRGGGARTDLAAFDSELVARAIAACPVPVITGVGHEIDRSVADEVAHTEEKTPTACAARIVATVAAAGRRVDTAWSSIARIATRELAACDDRLRRDGAVLAREARSVLDGGDATLASLAQRVGREARSVLDTNDDRLRSAAERTRRGATARVDAATARVEGHRGRMAGTARAHVRAEAQRLTTLGARLTHRAPRAVGELDRSLRALEARVRTLDPERTLARGWSITRGPDGSVVRHPDEVAPGDELITQVAGGAVRSTVQSPSTVDADG